MLRLNLVLVLFLSLSTTAQLYNNNSRYQPINQQCGRSRTNGGNIDGTISQPQDWPWMANIASENGRSTCAGFLISDEYILTVAHCIAFLAEPENIQITIGAVDLEDRNNDAVQNFSVGKIIVHPEFFFDENHIPNNDVAIIQLTSKVIVSRYVSPVCLPNGISPTIGQKCYATGYGKFNQGSNVTRTLQHVDLPIVSYSDCTQVYRKFINDSSHLCAGSREGGKDICLGNSGAPLVCQRCENCDWYAAGIVSFGFGCGKTYGVYTNVTTYENWIRQVTNITARQGMKGMNILSTMSPITSTKTLSTSVSVVIAVLVSAIVFTFIVVFILRRKKKLQREVSEVCLTSVVDETGLD